jgi:Domain of unknown function (DUF4376)
MQNYTIRFFDKTNGQIQIDYAGFPLITMNVPLDGNQNYLVGAQLDAFITNFLPTEAATRKRRIIAGVSNADAISSLVVPLDTDKTVFMPTTLSEIFKYKLVCLADWRFKTETAGISYMGTIIDTSRENQISINNMVNILINGFIDGVDNWKIRDGVYLTFTKDEFILIAKAVVKHVQDCFAKEKEITDKLQVAFKSESLEFLNAVIIPEFVSSREEHSDLRLVANIQRVIEVIVHNGIEDFSSAEDIKISLAYKEVISNITPTDAFMFAAVKSVLDVAKESTV